MSLNALLGLWRHMSDRSLVCFLSVLLLSGCATRTNPDPLENWNRTVFSFNDKVDRAVVRPVAKAYQEVTPTFFRAGVSNIYGNFKDVLSTGNLFLQGRPSDGVVGILRVGLNTTLGFGGLIDIATPMRLERTNEDFGQTLGVWGIGPGFYIVWPLFGPSTLRDSLGLPIDISFGPSMMVEDATAAAGLFVLRLVNTRVSLLGATDLLDDVALDPYAFVRNAYLQRRQNQIYNGDPPDLDEDIEN